MHEEEKGHKEEKETGREKEREKKKTLLHMECFLQLISRLLVIGAAGARLAQTRVSTVPRSLLQAAQVGLNSAGEQMASQSL